MMPVSELSGRSEAFLSRARSDAERLRDLVDMFGARPPAMTLASIGHLAHRLQDQAGTHGFRAIENAAIRLERLAGQLHAGDMEPLPGQFRAVTSAAHQLCAAIERSAD
jgi:HPt (histidine-containing phosphotransfer) domain-containing protein